MAYFAAQVNPLKCLEIDEPAGQGSPSADRLLDYLFAPEGDRTCEAFVQRYREIAVIQDPIPIAPAEPTILEKLVWPLRHAKGSYALGNYLGCVALCGMVGEMVAILLWDISKVRLRGAAMTAADQHALLGSTFEKLGQERRVEVLKSLDLVDEPTKARFDRLRAVRRQYLHFLSKTHGDLAADARRAYEDALQIVAVVLGQTYDKGAVVLRPDLMAYLREKGLVSEEAKNHGGAQ